MAAPGITVGSAWLDVLPSMKDFGGQLVQGVEKEGREAGNKAGEAAAEGTSEGLKGKVAMVAAAGAAIGLAIGAAVSQAMDISAGNAKLSAQLGLTANEGERYGRIAGTVFAGAYGDSLDQVNEAIKGVHQNISDNLSDAELQSITQGVLNLSSAFEVDLGGATAAIGQMLKTGLAPDAQSALDIVTVGFQSGVDKAGDFLDTLNEYGGQFQKLGIDGTTATGLLSQGLQAGARDADIVADALKEFSIRAIDGSTASADGFKLLGLNAAETSTQIAKGGTSASAGLQLVLDRLRAMQDPVDRNAAAVALFGTQAEDLGAALFALDPSSAVAALGQVGGAADRMNTTLGDTASSKLESFTRTLQMAFVTTVGGYVIPILTQLGTILGTLLGPALTLVGNILTGAGQALAEFGGWVQRNRQWVEPLAVGIGVFTLAVNASAIATALWGVATSAAAVVMGIARGAVLSFQVAMWLLNAAMTANPIGIVVALLAGLVAAIIWAWNNSETFRNIVIGAWEAIKATAMTVFGAIGDFLRVMGEVAANVWNAIVTGIQSVGSFFGWLWGIVSPVLEGIATVVKVVAAVILTILIAPVVLAINLLGMAFTWLWENAIRPAFDAIGVAANWLWNTIFQPVLAAIQVGLNALGAFFGWVYANLIKPALDAVGAAANFLWALLQTVFGYIQNGLNVLGAFFQSVYQSLIKPALDAIGAAAQFLWSGLQVVFGAIQGGLNALGGFFQSVYTGVIKPALDGIGAAANFVWNNILKPAFDAIGIAVRAVGDAFAWAVDRIGEVWGHIQAIVRPPIEFVVNVVYNSGIRPAWNFIAGLFGLGSLPELHFARGGLVPGRDTGKDYVPAMLRGGEGVLVPGAVSAIGGPAALDALNRKAENRPAKSGNWGYLGDWKNGRQHFADGGIAGWFWDTVGAVGDFVGGIVDFIADPVAAVKKVFAGIDMSGLGGAGQLSQALTAIPGKAIDAAAAWIKKLIGENAGGAGLPAALAWARTQAGKPYVWGGGGSPGWDCSGFIGGVTNVARGRPPGRIGTTFSMPWPGFVAGSNGAFVVGNTNAAEGHMAATLLGTNIETRGGDGTVIGGSARGAGDSLFPERYVFTADQGGMLPTGWSSVFNGTGAPEPILTGAQWKQLVDSTGGTDGASLDSKIGDLATAIKNQRPITVEDRSGNPVETARATQLALRLAR